MTEFVGEDFDRVSGDTEVVGDRGSLFTYTVYVQRSLGMRGGQVARRVDETLADRRGWTRGAVRFQRLSEGGTTPVLLAEPDAVDALCAPLDTAGEVSCCIHGRVVLNAVRWRRAVPHWPKGAGRLLSYRQMVINHEWGHRIGKGHGSCSGARSRAPVMMQQTYGLGECRANSWPLESELP